MRTTQAVFAIFVAFLSALLYSRAGVLSLMYTNAPSRMPKVNTFKDFDIKFASLVRNCEDAVLDTYAGFALLSCDFGRDKWNTVMGPVDNATSPAGTGIYIWHYEDASSQPEKLKLLKFEDRVSDFHPLGIEYQPTTQTITVVNLAKARSRIERFKLFTAEKAATHIGAIDHPSLSAPNSVVALSDSEYLFTNDHYFLRRNGAILPMLETYLGISGGSIVYLAYDTSTTNKPPTVRTLARLPFANGIALVNASTLAVASSADASVTLYSIDRPSHGDVPGLLPKLTIKVPFHTDNLSVDGNGKLLIAGHPHAPSLEEFVKNIGRCNVPGTEDKANCDQKAPSWISEWSEKDGLRTLYAGLDYAGSTTALRDVGRKIGLAVGLYGKGIVTWTS